MRTGVNISGFNIADKYKSLSATELMENIK
jgi:hypothetical protein